MAYSNFVSLALLLGLTTSMPRHNPKKMARTVLTRRECALFGDLRNELHFDDDNVT